MSVHKGRELLIELVGEDEFNAFERGGPLVVDAPHDEYSKVSYHIFKQGWSAGIHRIRHYSHMGDSTDYGQLKTNRREFYDAVAALVVAARTGNVRWGCGRLSVDLPGALPPKDLKFRTFLKAAVGWLYHHILLFPIWLFDLITGSDDENKGYYCLVIGTIGQLAFILILLLLDAMLFGRDAEGKVISHIGAWYLSHWYIPLMTSFALLVYSAYSLWRYKHREVRTW